MQLQLQFIIHFLSVSSGFHMDTHAFRSLLRVVCVLPILQGTCSTPNCRLLYHGYNVVTDDSWRKCRLLDHGYNAVAMTLGPAAMLCQDSALAPDRSGRKGRKRSIVVGPYIPYDLLQTKR
jgi:hypothetical protein